MGIGRSSLTFRMSARELMEILSGRRSHRAFEEGAGFATVGTSGSPMNPFESALRRGLTISAVRIERNSDLDDDWIEFRMEGPEQSRHHKVSLKWAAADISRPPRRSLLGRAELARHPAASSHGRL
jgi:hypothetical protein